MVFESIIAEVLNKVLGDYVENLDQSQLRIGIWGGDIVLKDLILKSTALDELDLPVRTKYGNLGSLIVKIPWTNLYNAPVICTIEDLYLLVVPNTQIEYSAEKEEKYNQDSKEAELRRVEDAKKLAREKDKPKGGDTFAEKLVTQIIKNLQVKIVNIHVRYEDSFSIPERPFAFGVTLHSVSVHSTDEKWEECVVQNSDFGLMVFKMLDLRSLAVYFNCNTTLFPYQDIEATTQLFAKTISKSDPYPLNKYVLAPINLKAQLRINPKPETDGTNFKTPKIQLGLTLERLALGITKEQYQSLFAFIDAIGMMQRATLFQKYRPHVPVIGHAKLWWKFAYECVLEHDIRRVRRNWSWDHMREHRELCRRYMRAYLLKLRRKATAEVNKDIAAFEKSLDVFNVIVLREEAEMQVDRDTQSAVQKGGWFRNWFSSAPKEEETSSLSAAAIMKKFEKAMTAEEKKKLFKAIDYQDNLMPTQYPLHFVENCFDFSLKGFTVEVLDETYPLPRVTFVELENVIMHLEQRPAADALKMLATIGSFGIYGMQQGDVIPHMVSYQPLKIGTKLIDMLVEINPLDGKCDQLVQVTSRPLEIVFDGVTILKIADIFTPPQNLLVAQLQAAAAAKFPDFKEMSAVGMQYAIEKHSILEINIDLSSSYVILPQSGLYQRSEDQNLIVVNLGHLSMVSMNQDRDTLETVKDLHDKGMERQAILEAMALKCYDKFVIRLDDIQILMVLADEDWKKTLASKERCAMHILEPTSLEILLLKCLLEDTSLPQCKMEAVLPSVSLNVEDERIIHMASLLNNLVPLDMEENEDEAEIPEFKLDTVSRVSTMSQLSRMATERPAAHHKMKANRASAIPEGSQIVVFQMDFVLKDLVISVFKCLPDKDRDSELLISFEIRRLVFSLVQETWDLAFYANVGTIQLNFVQGDGRIGMINVPSMQGEAKYMLLLKCIQAKRNTPDFLTKHGGVLQHIDLDVVGMTLLLHQEALLALWDFTRGLLEGMEAAKPSQSMRPQRPTILAPPPPTTQRRRNSLSLGSMGAPRAQRRAKPVEITDLKIVAKLYSFKIELLSKDISCAHFALEGGAAEVVVKKSYTEVLVKLKDFSAFDPNPESQHHEILSVMGSEALSLQVILFNNDMLAENEDAVDISIVVKTSAIRIFFLNWFFSRLMNFVRPFQDVQEMMQEAAKEAAEQALLNAKEAYQKSTRLALDVILQAPVIIVPANSKSIDALYLDMGTLIVKNRFEVLKAVNDDGIPATVDEITLRLQDLKLARVKLDENDHVASEVVLLKPLTGNVIVRRNLTSSWYMCIADVDISGRLETVAVSLCEDDFRTIMRIPQENMKEEDPIVELVKYKSIVHERDIAEESVTESVVLKPLPPASLRDRILSVDPVTTSVKFNFTLDSLILDLFTSSGLPEEGDMRMNTQENGLARFSLNFISVKGRVFSDLTISASLLLLDCLLDDTRPDSKSKIKRFMQRKIESSSDSISGDQPEETYRSMVDVTFQKKGDNVFVDVRVFGFDLVLSPEYLIKIADFFCGWTYEKLKEHRLNLQSKLRERQFTQKVSAGTTAFRPGTQAPPPSFEGSPPTPGTITLNLHVEKPDIVMVEHAEDLNTKALVLNTEITMKMRLSANHQCICGSIKDLQLFSCVYNPAKRNESIYQILRPCSVSVAGSTPGEEGLHIDVCITPIRLSVSAGTLELITNVQRGLSLPEANLNKDHGEIDHSKLWNPTSFSEDMYWYLLPETAVEASKALIESTPKTDRGELCIISVSSVVMTVEAGIGIHTIPMILVEMSFNGAMSNWSSQLIIDSCVSLEVKFYNSSLAMWEPLLEPIELQEESGAVTHVPWELRLQLQVNALEDRRPSSPSSDMDIEELPPPATTIEISSKENLEITLSKTCINVLTQLAKSFQTAISGTPLKVSTAPPFTVKNDTGLAIALLLENSPFQVMGSDDPSIYKEVMLENGAKVEMCLADPDIEDVWNLGLQRETTEEDSLVLEQYLRVRVIERNCQLSLPVRRADKRYFSLKHRGEGNEPWGLVSDVQVRDGGTFINIRSIIQILNHFNMPINVYYMTKRGNEVECIGTVEHKGTLNVPLYAVYTPTNELFFSVNGYTVSIEPFIWKNLQNSLSLTKNLQCDPKLRREEKEPFIMKILGEMEQVFFENTSRHTMQSTCYNIHLRPTVIFKNHLPLSLVVCLANSSVEEVLEPGQRLQLPTAEPGKVNLILRIPEYLEKEWSCDHELEPNPHEYTVWTFSAYDSQQRVNLDLGMRTVLERGSVIMTLYCPYWMLNKTGLMICYRKSRKLGNETSGGGSPLKQGEESVNVLYHPENFKGPVLFSFKAKSFFGKKKGSIKVEDSDWSDKFPLDVAGSSGLVSCRQSDITYKIGVHIQLTFSSLTKQVTFTPYYVLLNNAAYPIEVQEGDRPADPWIRVEPNGCSALWPKSSKSQLHARVVGTAEMTPLFAYDNVYTTLLRVDNKYGGLNLDVQMAEGSVYISFMSYDYGLAPCFILNCLDFPVSYHEKDVDEINYLEPMTSVMFTWAKPTGSRTLVWANQTKKDFNGDLRRDGIGEFAVDGDRRAFWVSFLDGMQRVLLFTSNFSVARDAQSAGELERVDTEITLAIHGMGLSLVNDALKHEVLYCSIASSGVVWEMCKPNHTRYRPLNAQDNRLVEEAYEQHQQNQQYVLEFPPSVTLDNGMEIDFEKGEISKPAHRLLRRSYSTGLWVQMKNSKHQVQLHAKVKRLQVDNQMADHLFPVVMAPVPLPRSISAASGLKPFLELSIVKRLMEHSPVVQYKYFKVLVQEFHIKLDIGFINALVHFFEPQTQDEEEYLRFKEDLRLVNEPLMSHALLQSSAEQKNFYDLLHFSPLKIHLSFSLSSSGSTKIGGEEAAHFINVLMQSLGVTLTDMQDVVFKLAYFERQYTFLTQRQLTAEVNTHYLGQLLRQLYVLVLGLDVLGNPYGLVVGMAQGVEDLFYEPFQGAIQGPGEFAEGLVLGVRSLVGHTVGGAAGAVSRITGAMGKGVAALTFDKDYQRKRREAIAHRPSNVHMGLAQSSKGLVMGVVAGVSGVFTKPVQGARQEGVEGFFKGVGKGVVGLVTRPTAGIIDFASGTLEQVKRAADPSEEVRRMRPPRFMHPDGQLRPYARHEAEGSMILSMLEKGRYSTTDVYAFHVGIVSGAKDVLLLTDKRVLYIVHNDVFGGWQVEWEYTWDSLAAPPTEVDKGIYITTGESQKKVLGIFRSGDKGGKIIIVENKDELQWLLKKMNEIMEQSS